MKGELENRWEGDVCGLIEGKILEVYHRERTIERLRQDSKQQFPITNDSPYV